MKKYFVTYEQALALKELGFDEPCFGFYSVLYDLMITQTNGKKSLFELECLAPLKSQVFEWFRNYSELYYIQSLIQEYDINNYMYSIDDGVQEDISVTGFETYEEAESACIDALIVLIKNK